MVVNRKNLPLFLGLLLFGTVIGSLGWEIVERIIQAAGSSLSLTLDTPIILDVHVVALSLRPNLGTLLGGIGGVILFFLL